MSKSYERGLPTFKRRDPNKSLNRVKGDGDWGDGNGYALGLYSRREREETESRWRVVVPFSGRPYIEIHNTRLPSAKRIRICDNYAEARQCLEEEP